MSEVTETDGPPGTPQGKEAESSAPSRFSDEDRDQKITRDMIIERATFWLGPPPVAYDQEVWAPDPDGYTYRSDCSGYVSMAWKLGPSPTTWDLATNAYATEISRDDLQPGDVLIFNNPVDPVNLSHIVIFDAWVDAALTRYRVYQQTVPHTAHGEFTMDHTGYVAYRYNNVIDSRPALAAEYSIAHPRGDWVTGERQAYRGRVHNTGYETWKRHGENRVRLGIHFSEPGVSDTPHDRWYTDERFDLPMDVRSGEAVDIEIQVTPPPIGGAYMLRHRMVKEYVAWFDQIDKIPVNVRQPIWSGWLPLDAPVGGLSSAPTVSSWSTERYDCFARAAGDSDMWIKNWFNRSWHDWSPLGSPGGGDIKGAPAAVSWGPDRIDCFVWGADGAMWAKSWNGALPWIDWHTLGGPRGGLTSGPAATSRGVNRLDCFVRGADAAVWAKSWEGTSWSDWHTLGSPPGGMKDAPAAVSWGPDRIDCFVWGADGAMWTKSWNGNSWTKWQSLGSPGSRGLTCAPAVSSWGSNRLDCFAGGADNLVWTKSWNGSNWGDWHSLGSPVGKVIQGSPAVVAHPGGIDAFVTGDGNRMWHNYCIVRG
jgi:hypothetical protein